MRTHKSDEALGVWAFSAISAATAGKAEIEPTCSLAAGVGAGSTLTGLVGAGAGAVERAAGFIAAGAGWVVVVGLCVAQPEKAKVKQRQDNIQPRVVFGKAKVIKTRFSIDVRC
jgi:hypothetical protein